MRDSGEPPLPRRGALLGSTSVTRSSLRRGGGRVRVGTSGDARGKRGETRRGVRGEGTGSHLAGFAGGSGWTSSGRYASAMAPEAHNAAISSVSAALSLGFGVLSTLRARRRVGRVVSTRSGGGGSREDKGREDATARRNVEGPRVQTHRIAASTSVNSASGASVVIAPDHAASRARSGMGKQRHRVLG